MKASEIDDFRGFAENLLTKLTGSLHLTCY